MNEELKIVLKAEISNMKKNVSDAKKTIKDFVKDGTKDFGKMNDEMQKYGDASGKALKIVAGAVAGVTTALLGVTALTSEYREGQAKLATAFEAAGSNAETAKNTYNDLYNVLGDSDVTVEAANHLAKLTQDQQSLSEWTDICRGVYATFGDSLPIEGLTEAANETAKTGALTGSLADALNWAGVNEEAFQAKLDDCNTEAEREATIRTTLNGLYQEASAQYAENNAQILAQNEANRKMTDAMAKLGETMAPVNTMLTELGADILTQLTPYIEDFANNYLPIIKEELSNVGEKIGVCLTWVADHWETITTIGGIILGVSVAVKAVAVAFALVNAVSAASPVTWIVLGIVAAVAALSAGVVLCIKHWDDIKATVHNVIENVKTTVKNGVDKLKSLFKFKWELPKIKLPHFKIAGSFSLNPPSIPHFSVAWYKNGGVFDKPALFGYGNGAIGGLGEAGAEAVVPLEKNTEWLDKIAERLYRGSQVIQLIVDKRVLGEATVESINDITAQTGDIPLKLY